MLFEKAREKLRVRLIAGLLVLGICALAACGRDLPEDTVSAGQMDNVNGFLFIFDNRSAQQQLVRDMDEGRDPLSMTCERYNIERDVSGEETEVLDEEATIFTEDTDLMRSVYNAMTEMIVVGQIGKQDNDVRCRITYVLSDGKNCVFDFETVSIIQISGQNYVVESSGRLWELLPIFPSAQ